MLSMLCYVSLLWLWSDSVFRISVASLLCVVCFSFVVRFLSFVALVVCMLVLWLCFSVVSLLCVVYVSVICGQIPFFCGSCYVLCVYVVTVFQEFCFTCVLCISVLWLDSFLVWFLLNAMCIDVLMTVFEVSYLTCVLFISVLW